MLFYPFDIKEINDTQNTSWVRCYNRRIIYVLADIFYLELLRVDYLYPWFWHHVKDDNLL